MEIKRPSTRPDDDASVRLREDTLPQASQNTVQLVTLFALSNLWMARQHLLTGAGEVRL